VVTTSTTTEPVAKDAVLMLSTRYNNVPMVIGYNGKFNFEILYIFNPKKKLVGGAPLLVKRAETPLSTSFFLGLKCFITFHYF